MDDRYFATLPTGEVGQALLKKIDDYYEYLQYTGRYSVYKLSYNQYYKPTIEGGTLYNTGEQKEYVQLHVNHYRNVILHLMSLILNQRPAFEPRAANSDYKSQCQTILAQGLLDYYMREKHLEDRIHDAVEKSSVFGEGWVYVGWNAVKGQMYGVNPETNAPIYEGDIDIETFDPTDVIRDYASPTNSDHNWFIIRRRTNRYMLADQFPEKRPEIMSIQEDVTSLRKLFNFNRFSKENDEIVSIYSFYHKPCTSLPNGRIIDFLDADTILIDAPLPYRDLPCYRIVMANQQSSCFGYSNIWDLIPVQQGIDRLYATIASNEAAFGMQNIVSPKGSGVDVTKLAGGLNLIEYDGKLGPPQPLNLLSTSPETFKFLEILVSEMERLSAMSSTIRGNPEASLKSGSALALVQSLAVQFSQPYQQSYAMLLESVGTAIIKILRDFASVPRIAMISGKSNRTMMKQFKGDDLDQVDRVMVDMGNPMAQTTAGKINLAEQLMQGGLIKNPDQYIQVVSTGQLDPIIQGDQSELLNIRSENEELGEGRPVMAVVTDNHPMHIQEHKSVLASPDARKDQSVLQVTLAHLQEHIDLLRSSDPQLLMILGMQPLPPLGIPAGQPSPQMEGSVPQTESPQNPVEKNAGNVELPGMPSMPKPAGSAE